MKQFIKIKVINEPDDDGLFRFEVYVSNGQSSATLAIWGYADNFKTFGNKLTEFPMGQNQTVTYELGDERVEGEAKWAYYLLLKVSFEPSGPSTIKIIVDNHESPPDYLRAEFYLKAESASLNRLGQELQDWNPGETKELEWFAD